MRRNGFAGSQNWVMRIIFINVAVYLIQIIAQEHLRTMIFYFGLMPALVIEKYYIWQVFTYMFLHGSFFHIFLNLYALMLFGMPVEQLWGSRKFLLYYFFSGVGAGISILVINTILGGSLPYTPTIGASGAVFGLLLAFGMLFPDVELLVFFVIPMKAKYLVVLYGAIEFFSLVSSGGESNVSHVGHLGGILFGLIFFMAMRKRGIEYKARKIKAKISKEIKAGGTVLPTGKNEDVAKLLLILQKVKGGGPEALSDDEFQYVRLKEIIMDGGVDLCVEEDFDYNDEYCLKCEDVEACLIREIKKYL